VAAQKDKNIGQRPTRQQSPPLQQSKAELARSALGYDLTEGEAQRIVRPHVCRLQKKIEPGSADRRLIRTISGRGYGFDP
jgi:DNA-binding response OmpR family regulator